MAMTKTQYMQGLVIDILVGILMLVVLVGAVILSVPSPTSVSNSIAPSAVSKTAMGSYTDDTAVIRLQPITTLPEPPFAQTGLIAPSTVNIAAAPAPYVTQDFSSVADIPNASERLVSADYVGIFAIATALYGLVGLINHSFRIVYRVGLPKL